MGRRPSHVIQMECSSLDPVKALCDGAKRFIKAERKGIRNGVFEFEAEGEVCTCQRIYEEFGIAIVDLNPEEFAKIKNAKGVRQVAENRIRSLPQYAFEMLQQPESAGLGQRAKKFDDHDGLGIRARNNGTVFRRSSGQTVFHRRSQQTVFAGRSRQTINRRGKRINSFEGFTPDPSLNSTRDLVSYIQGQRDALNSVLRLMEESGSNFDTERYAYLDDGLTWALHAVGLASNDYPFSGKGVRVAVLDTGVSLKHPDLTAPAVARSGNRKRARLSRSLLTDCVSGDRSPNDLNGHGSHCAGLIGGPRSTLHQNGFRYSVSPDSEMIISKVADDRGIATDGDIIEGISFATENKARVISLSIGEPRGSGDACDPLFEHLADCLLNGRVGHPKGCLIFAAAGNGSTSEVIAPVDNPAACSKIVSIGAINPDGSIASFSNGQTDSEGAVDFCAPGVDILSTHLEDGFAIMTGSSMAVPIAAGVAALHFEKNPELDAQEIWKSMERTATPLGPRALYGNGLVQSPWP